MKARKQRMAEVEEATRDAAHRSLTMARKLDQVVRRSAGAKQGDRAGNKGEIREEKLAGYEEEKRDNRMSGPSRGEKQAKQAKQGSEGGPKQ